jgi:phosphoribosylformylglycinamidine synthase
MAHRIEVGVKPELFDAQGHIDAQRIHNSLGLEVDVKFNKIYTADLGLSEADVQKFSKELIHPLVNTVNAAAEPAKESENAYVIEVGYKPGVMDPEGRSAKILAEDILGRKFQFDKKIAVQYQRLIKSKSPLTDVQLKKIANLFYNGTVQNFKILSFEDFKKGIEPYVPTVRVPPPEAVKHYDLNLDDEKLLKISEERVLALNADEMKAIKAHYNDPKIIEARKKIGLSEKATDIELELFGQTWSEHCKHKIFNASVTYKEGEREEKYEKGIFSKFIKDATLALQKQKPELIKSVLWDNSGVVDFDPNSQYYVCFKCETHNSPTNMEPYGGAITGYVGVVRDDLGTGRGSLVISGLWWYCVGSLFYDGDLRPLLHPDLLLDGAHRGVRDGANKHGIPAGTGGAFFDNSYLGKCLLYAGVIGAVPKIVDGKPGYEKWINPSDRCIVVGGRVGKDGIHGATASSQEYHEGTPAGHVQIGDPYTQKNVQEFMLDALKEGLINFAQDSGAGGIGSAAGEMAQYSNGAILDLDKDLFKYEGLAPWEILESESQERMFMAVNPGKMKRLVELAEKWNVEWRDVGEFTDTGYFHVRYKGETVAYTNMDFLHGGVPQKQLNAVWKTPEERGLKEPSAEKLGVDDYAGLLHNVLMRENIASKEFLQREYDTRVQGKTVIPAFIGEKSDVPSDAFVQKIEYGLPSGIACGIGLNPYYSHIDTYDMTLLAANEGLMRVVAVGGDPDRAVNNGNYCWPGVLPDESDESEYKMSQLVRAAKAQYDFATATGVATVSGKDSMKIQGNISDVNGKRQRVYGLPAIQFATIAPVADVNKCVTADFKMTGDAIYFVGLPTKDELGGSEFYQSLGEIGLNAPKVDLGSSMKVYRALHKAMDKEYVESAKVCSKGGLAVALASASFAGGLGAYIDMKDIPTDMAYDDKVDTKLLYSESASRFLVSVAPENIEAFEGTMGQYAKQIGNVADKYVEIIGTAGNRILKEDGQKLKESWQSTFKHKMYQGAA